MAEQRTHKPWVVGSSPTLATERPVFCLRGAFYSLYTVDFRKNHPINVGYQSSPWRTIK